MSAPTLDEPAGPRSAARAEAVPFWSGVVTVARLELRQRVRSSRWVLVLVVWAAVLLLLTGGITWSVRRAYLADGLDVPAQAEAQAGRLVFGLVTLLVLSLAALVVPALTATSINGDRAAGVLATLQTTLLTPVQIVAGKLLAAWAVALALVATATPFLVWSFVGSQAPIGRLLVVLAVLAVTLLVICAIGLGWSSVTARTSSSTLLTYLCVVFLGLGLPVLFAISVPLVNQTDEVPVRSYDTPAVEVEPGLAPGPTGPPQCTERVETMNRAHTERSWWLLAPSPYVVIADASPRPTGNPSLDSDPLTLIRSGVREARLGPADTEDYCYDDSAASRAREAERQADRERLGATWPAGLATDVGLGLVALAVAVRRLRAPLRTLPRGTRVA